MAKKVMSNFGASRCPPDRWSACLHTERIAGLLLWISGNCKSECAYAHGFPVLLRAFMWSYFGLALKMAGCLIGAWSILVGWFAWGLKPRGLKDFATLGGVTLAPGRRH
jgi:hypothetical protein